MAKKLRAHRKPLAARNWIAYLCESLVASGAMPTWDAAAYLTENLFGEKPNPRLLSPSHPHEVTSLFLRRLYQPVVEAAAREVNVPRAFAVHLFTDISLTGHSGVLVVLLCGTDKPQHLVLLDGVKAWDLVFPDADSFNSWIEERYRRMVDGLRRAILEVHDEVLTPA